MPKWKPISVHSYSKSQSDRRVTSSSPARHASREHGEINDEQVEGGDAGRLLCSKLDYPHPMCYDTPRHSPMDFPIKLDQFFDKLGG